MVKSTDIKAVAVGLVALVFAYASDARAGEVVSNEVFSSGTSFERLDTGSFDPSRSDDGDLFGPYYWSADSTNELARVTMYVVGEAYDYGARGSARSPYLSERIGSTNDQYLTVTATENLHRSIIGRYDLAESFSNVLVRSETRESVYLDLLTKFIPGEVEPLYDETARVVVWAQLLEPDEDDPITNLIVTAGCFTNSFKEVTARQFRLEVPGGLDVGKWYRLTIRAHGDVSARGIGLSAFSIYLDGQPLRAREEDYEICDPLDAQTVWLQPEARVLQSERRLFPGLVKPGQDRSFTVSGFTFTGDGYVDDITFSSEDPGYAPVEDAFTLNWDAGVTTLKYTLDGGLTTNAAPVDTARSCDILLGGAVTNGVTLKVLEVAYNEAGGYHAGVWMGSNGATLTNGTEFVVTDAAPRNPIASIASTRDFISIGGGGFDTFTAALAYLKTSTNETKTIVLSNDFTVAKADGGGSVTIEDPNGAYVLDLNGHELRGSGKTPTVIVRCRALRIIDSSLEKTGAILPSGTYLSAKEQLNTSVAVYPWDTDGECIRPVLTLAEGIYDGWVRNNSRVYGDASVRGTVIVEGGYYLSTNTASFYLDECVTNACSQFVFRENYWSCLATNAFVWTGLGDGLHWADTNNWKGLALPGPSDTALFPSRGEGLPDWTVDVGANGMTTMNLWLEGDILLSGTNAFKDVRLTADAAGRIGGTATLVYEGEQPGSLTETTLRDDWAGTVLLRKVGTGVPKVLKHIETWGTAHSTVVFNGVRGYVMDTASHTMPYDFVLEDWVEGGTTNLAWQNDSGYTGSTLAFTGRLLGRGTFKSGANVRAILQLFKFANAQDFRGRFAVDGKRVLIGSESVMSSVPGLIAFGNCATVASDLGWTCRYALFGSALRIIGQTNDVLVTCSKAEPDVSSCTNVLLNGSSVVWLACTNDPAYAVYVSGTRPEYATQPASLSSMRSAVFASAAAVSESDGYSRAALRAEVLAQAVSAIQETEVSLEVGEDAIRVIIADSLSDIWYGVRYRATLTDEWSEPCQWRKSDSNGDTLVLTFDKLGDSGFYEVVGSIEDPTAGGGAE